MTIYTTDTCPKAIKWGSAPKYKDNEYYYNVVQVALHGGVFYIRFSSQIRSLTYKRRPVYIVVEDYNGCYNSIELFAIDHHCSTRHLSDAICKVFIPYNIANNLYNYD